MKNWVSDKEARFFLMITFTFKSPFPVALFLTPKSINYIHKQCITKNINRWLVGDIANCFLNEPLWCCVDTKACHVPLLSSA